MRIECPKCGQSVDLAACGLITYHKSDNKVCIAGGYYPHELYDGTEENYGH